MCINLFRESGYRYEWSVCVSGARDTLGVRCGVGDQVGVSGGADINIRGLVDGFG